MALAWRIVLIVAAVVAVVFFTLWQLPKNPAKFVFSLLNGATLAGIYFLLASGFTLVFGLMRNVNLAHGSLYLLGGYIGWVVADRTDVWMLGVAAGFLSTGFLGLLMQVLIFRWMQGEDMRQTLVTIGLSIVMADIMLWVFGGLAYQLDPPRLISTSVSLPVVGGYSTYKLILLAVSIAVGVLLWFFLARTRIGMMIRAGVDDRGMLQASGTNVQLVFALTFAVGAGLAGLAGVLNGGEEAFKPGEDVGVLLGALLVVIVGGMGSIVGAAIGSVLIGVIQAFGLAYAETYAIVFTFVAMVIVLAFRPQGILGAKA
jgi:branched-chain amino acid transport system permease protein